MPALITHYIFGENMIKVIKDENACKLINKWRDVYNLGLQGPDIFFYNLPVAAKVKNKGIGSKMHSEHTGEFFSNYMEILDTLSGREKEIALVYLYGFICHYVLDTKTHPFIIYNSGFVMEEERDRRYYSSNHRQLESDIDSAMCSRYLNRDIAGLDREKLVDIHKYEILSIAHVLSEAINRTYEEHISVIYVIKSIKWLRMGCRFLTDKSGMKYRVTKTLENIFVGYDLMTSLMNDKKRAVADVLNEKGAEWVYPWDSSMSSTCSFKELFDEAATCGAKLITLLDEHVFYGYDKASLLSIFGNKSYLTGVDCTRRISLKCFKNSRSDIINETKGAKEDRKTTVSI